MKNPIQSFQEATSETKQFLITVAILFVIVLGTFVYAFWRIDDVRTAPAKENVQAPR